MLIPSIDDSNRETELKRKAAEDAATGGRSSWTENPDQSVINNLNKENDHGSDTE